jgi:hypothetical protein
VSVKTWKVDPQQVKELYDPQKPFQNLEQKSTDGDAKGAARFMDKYSCSMHQPFYLQPVKPPCVWADYLPIVRLGDFGICLGAVDIVKEGAATFLVCGLPVARKDDGMMHGGLIMEGSSTVMIGGPTFALPSNITIKGDNAKYQNEVIRDLYFLSTTKTGQEILDRLDAAKQPIEIEQVELDDSKTRPMSKTDQQMGRPTGAKVKYDPDTDNFTFKDKDGKVAGMPPQVSLAHELIHGMHMAEGTATGDDDWEESRTEGFPLSPAEEKRRKASDDKIAKANKLKPGKPPPTENQLRDELHLEQRIDHKGEFSFDPPETRNFRPGDCH